MFVTIAVVFLVLWLLGFSVFNVAGGVIHVLLVLAILSFLWHVLAGRRGRS